MEEYSQAAWEELVERCQEAGVDAFEINFSCPHGMPERRMGMSMGQDCDILSVRRCRGRSCRHGSCRKEHAKINTPGAGTHPGCCRRCLAG